MRLLIHDLPENPFPDAGDGMPVIRAAGGAAPCQGCFQCWTKNAGYCVYADALQHCGAAAGGSEAIIVVSQICYGGYSSGIKRFFDRGISDSLPFLTYRDGKTYHMERYRRRRELAVYFYGSCSSFERETAREYVERHAVNMNAAAHSVSFVRHADDLRGCGL